MGFSTDSESFLINSKEAYNKFQKHQIPFAAVKLYISGAEGTKDKVDRIIKNNFRTDKDFVLKTTDNYSILMQQTSINSAKLVISRISKKLSQLKNETNNISQKLKAHACIYAANEKNDKLQLKYIDLINPSVRNCDSDNYRDRIKEYLKWTKPIISKKHEPFSVKV